MREEQTDKKNKTVLSCSFYYRLYEHDTYRFVRKQIAMIRNILSFISRKLEKEKFLNGDFFRQNKTTSKIVEISHRHKINKKQNGKQILFTIWLDFPSIIQPSFYKRVDCGSKADTSVETKFFEDFLPKFVYILGKVTNLLNILWYYFTRVDPEEIQTQWCS